MMQWEITPITSIASPYIACGLILALRVSIK